MSETKERLVFAAAGRKLDESELRAAFAGVQDDTPIWQAMQQLLLEEFENTINDTGILASGDHGPLAASAGGMEALGQFYAKLQDHFNDAHEVRPKEE